MIRDLLAVAVVALCVACATPDTWVGLASATLAVGVTGGCAIGGLAHWLSRS